MSGCFFFFFFFTPFYPFQMMFYLVCVPALHSFQHYQRFSLFFLLDFRFCWTVPHYSKSYNIYTWCFSILIQMHYSIRVLLFEIENWIPVILRQTTVQKDRMQFHQMKFNCVCTKANGQKTTTVCILAFLQRFRWVWIVDMSSAIHWVSV